MDRNGEEVRYVIDFYKGSTPSPPQKVPDAAALNKPPIEPAMAIYLDIRPAVDSFSAVRDRIQMAIHMQYTTLRMKYPWLNILNRSKTDSSHDKEKK